MTTDEPDPATLAALQLALAPGIGPRTHAALTAEFGSPAAVLAAAPDEWRRVKGVGAQIVSSLSAARDPAAARAEWQRCRELGIWLAVPGQPRYPQRLAEIGDRPPVIYGCGDLLPQDAVAVAIVGSRSGTVYGLQQAEKLAAGLARAGVTIISGLARGIDSAAHRGALQAGGRTIAVLATDVRNVYPPEHAELAAEIAAHGAVLSESPLDRPVRQGAFPQRNRIISGLALGVVVVEAARNGGALHTVRHAMEQGREVFAVPGRIDVPYSAGCHDLIRDGVTLIRGVEDVLEGLGPLPQPAQAPIGENARALPFLEADAPVPAASPPHAAAAARPADEARTVVHEARELLLNEQERIVLNLVQDDPRHVDEVLRECPLDAPRVLQTLTVLEMKRLIRRLPGGMLTRPFPRG